MAKNKFSLSRMVFDPTLTEEEEIEVGSVFKWEVFGVDVPYQVVDSRESQDYRDKESGERIQRPAEVLAEGFHRSGASGEYPRLRIVRSGPGGTWVRIGLRAPKHPDDGGDPIAFQRWLDEKRAIADGTLT